MKEKFTKGPWHRSAHANGCVYVTHKDMRRNSGHFIASLSGRDEVANANLIAAAPKMYKFLDDLAHGRGTDYPIEQLLSEARGEEQ